jgi:hypothetical protein
MRCWVLLGAVAVLGGAATAPLVCVADGSRSGIVCWTDEHGQRSCGDHVPPQYAKSQREIYDNRGVLIQTLKAEQTAEQRAADETAAQEAERAQKQQLNDSFLLQSYRSVEDLEAARDSRMQTLDTRLDLAEKAVQSGQQALTDLQDRADAERVAGKEADPALDNQIKSFEASQAENIKAVARIKQDREDTAAQYQHDIHRYQELRGANGSATPTAPPTPAAPQTPRAAAPAQAPQPR